MLPSSQLKTVQVKIRKSRQRSWSSSAIWELGPRCEVDVVGGWILEHSGNVTKQKLEYV